MRRTAGFTLIELLAGAAISAVLLAALYGVLSGVLRLKRSSYEALDRALPETAVAAMLKADLADMVAPAGLLSDAVYGEERNEGGARSDLLEFCTARGEVSASRPYPSVRKIEYYLATSDEETTYPSLQLMRAETGNLLATNVEDTRTVRSLLSDVYSLEFEYYDGENWTTSWDSSTAEPPLPRAVRARITLDREEPGTVERPTIEVFCEIASEAVGAAEEATP